jgi:hypothetical protein
VYDISKINLVEGVRVESTSGKFTYTDTLGKYNLLVTNADSVFFVYKEKPTQKFAVKDIGNPTLFDIKLHTTVKSKYTTLKEVIVQAKSYKQDSIENREHYARYFGYKKPGLQTDITPSGGVGLDVNELINVFRFKRNRRMKAFQNRLEEIEKEKYITYRFNKIFVKRVTELSGVALDSFMVKYRPDYEFTSQSDLITFTQYVLNASYHYKAEMLKEDEKKLKAN